MRVTSQFEQLESIPEVQVELLPNGMCEFHCPYCRCTPMKTLHFEDKMQFPVGTRVRLVAAPDWRGEIVSVEADSVKVSWRVGDSLATGRHNPDVLERIDP